MRNLVVTEFLSLDGVYQAPGDPSEDTDGGFSLGGWQRPYFDEELGAAAAEGMARTDAQLFGRKTYQIMAAYWPNAPEDDPYGKHLNAVRKYVASNTLSTADWANTEVLSGDVVDQIRRIKEMPGGDVTVLGSGNLVRTLAKHDLVDTYFLAVYPIVLGRGKRLFEEADLTKLELVDSKPTATGGVLLTYRPAWERPAGKGRMS
jgi:dihydrofolate reductase